MILASFPAERESSTMFLIHIWRGSIMFENVRRRPADAQSRADHSPPMTGRLRPRCSLLPRQKGFVEWRCDPVVRGTLRDEEVRYIYNSIGPSHILGT